MLQVKVSKQGGMDDWHEFAVKLNGYADKDIVARTLP
jgi:hypothetical protein